jgi:hypothetical protein
MRGKLEDDVDALFRLPLAEFIGARNTLAAQLKKSGRGDEKAEAVLVKAMVKPSISAWAVNQLYWNHREAFDRLITSGEHFHKAQASRLGGKLADMRTALDTRREALTQLSDLATRLLRDAGPNPGQNPSLDIIRRITTTLEGVSAYAARSDGPRPGRLTHDVDPPGFESLASFTPDAVITKATREPRRFAPSQKPQKSGTAAKNTLRKVAPDTQVHQLEERRKAGIAAAKGSLQDAKRVLIEARARAKSLQAAQKKAFAEAKEAEKQSRAAEERWKKTRAAAEEAAQRMRSVAAQVEEAAKSVEAAKSTVGKASEELEKLFRDSPGR